MFAKGNVNPPACASSADACKPASTKCCPGNSAVFQYVEGVPATKGKVAWNFEKFLVGKDGVPVARIGASKDPTELTGKIDALLAGR